MASEPVFISASMAEIGRVEKLLDEEGIEYSVRPHEFFREGAPVCLNGLLFEVPAPQAEACRRLLRERGLVPLEQP